MDVHPPKNGINNVLIGIDPYPYIYTFIFVTHTSTLTTWNMFLRPDAISCILRSTSTACRHSWVPRISSQRRAFRFGSSQKLTCPRHGNPLTWSNMNKSTTFHWVFQDWSARLGYFSQQRHNCRGWDNLKIVCREASFPLSFVRGHFTETPKPLSY